jgi:hypothetical protein
MNKSSVIAASASPFLMVVEVLALRLVSRSMKDALSNVREMTVTSISVESLEALLAMFHRLRILRVLRSSAFAVHPVSHAFASCPASVSGQIVYDLHLHQLSFDFNGTSTVPCSHLIPAREGDVDSLHPFFLGLKTLVVRQLASGQAENLLLWLCGSLSTCGNPHNPHNYIPNCWYVGTNHSLLELHLSDSVDFSNFHCGVVLSLCTQLLVLDIARCGLLTAIGPLLNIACLPVAVTKIVPGVGLVVDAKLNSNNCQPDGRMLLLRKLKIRNCCLFQLDCFSSVVTARSSIASIFEPLSASQLCYLSALDLSGSSLTSAQCADILQVEQSGVRAGRTEASARVCCFPQLRRLVISRCAGLEGTLRLDAHVALTGLAYIDLSHCSRLKHLYVNAPSLSSISVSGLAALKSMCVCAAKLSELDLSQLHELRLVQLGHCPRLRVVNLTGSHMADVSGTVAAAELNPRASNLLGTFDQWLGRPGAETGAGPTMDRKFAAVDCIMEQLVLPMYHHSTRTCESRDGSTHTRPVVSGNDAILAAAVRTCIESLGPSSAPGPDGDCVDMRLLQLMLLKIDSIDITDAPRKLVGLRP